MKLDLLAFSAHPDDAELGCGGTLLAEIDRNKTVGVADLTRGELGTRGNAETRAREAAAASEILGLSARHNLGLADGFFRIDRDSLEAVIRIIRLHQPDVLLAPAISDRHPDHGRAAQLIKEASFLAGLRRIDTTWEDQPQEVWRPAMMYHYIQDRHIIPDLAVDISPYMEQKMEAVKAFGTQFHNADSEEPETYISNPEFLNNLYSRAMEMGRPVGFKYAEGFTVDRTPGLRSLFDLH